MRKGGRGAHDLKMDKINFFNKSTLGITEFDKGLLLDTTNVNTACEDLRFFTNKDLFRKAMYGKYLDTLGKVLNRLM